MQRSQYLCLLELREMQWKKIRPIGCNPRGTGGANAGEGKWRCRQLTCRTKGAHLKPFACCSYVNKLLARPSLPLLVALCQRPVALRTSNCSPSSAPSMPACAESSA
eukprot:357930-Chlamydomonas_euryale.AAC.1